MKTYLKIFINFKQNNSARLLPITKFAYNNAKNASTGHISFELNCEYHSQMSYKGDIDSRSKCKLVNKWFAEL